MEKFPKQFRFSIGQSLVTASIELLMNLVDATYQVRNAGSLGAAVREVNRIHGIAEASIPASRPSTPLSVQLRMKLTAEG